MSDTPPANVVFVQRNIIDDGLALHTCSHRDQQLCMLHKNDDGNTFSHAKHLQQVTQLVPKRKHLIYRRTKLYVAQYSFLIVNKFRQIKMYLSKVRSCLDNFNSDLLSSSASSPYTLHQHNILAGVDDSLNCFHDIFSFSLSLTSTLKSVDLSCNAILSSSYAYLSERLLQDLVYIKRKCDAIIRVLVELRQLILSRKCNTDVTFVTFIVFHLHKLLNISYQFIRTPFFSQVILLSGIPTTRLKNVTKKYFNNTMTVNNFIDVFVQSRSKIVTNKLLYQTGDLFERLHAEITQPALDENGNKLKPSDNDSLNSTLTISSNGKVISETKMACRLLRKIYSKMYNDESMSFASFLLEISDISTMGSKNNVKDKIYFNPNNLNDASSTNKVGWTGPIDAKQRANLCSYFDESLWSCVCKSMFLSHTSNSILSTSDRWVHTKSIAHARTQRDVIWKTKLKLAEDGLVPSPFLSSLSELIMSMTACDALQEWDTGMCQGMSISLKDHFRYKKETATTTPSSATIKKCLANQTAIQDILKVLNRKDMVLFQNGRRQLRRDLLFSLHTFINFFRVILPARRQSYLSSASWEPFFVVASLDLKILMLYIDRLLKNLEVVFPSIKSEDAILFQFYEACISFEERSFNLLVHTISNRSQQLFKQNMPNPRTWRRRGSSVKVYQANSFVTVALQSLFSPFLEACACLPRLVMMRILSRCVTSFLKYWMEHILDDQILFSLFGCQQLLFDLNSFLQTFENEEFGLSVDEVSDIFALPVVQQFRNAIILLSCQPQSTKEKRDLLGSELKNGSVGSTQSILSQVSIESVVGNEFDEVIGAIDLHDKERWLALRAKGGGSKRAFLCIK